MGRLIHSALVLLVLLPVKVVGYKGISVHENARIAAHSKLGKSLLRRSRNLGENNFEYDNSWLAGYSIQYQGCHSILRFADGEGEGGGNNKNNEEGRSKLYMQNLVEFRMCPVDSCGKDCVGKYLINMGEFVDAYTEYSLDEQEMACENVRENCVCDDDGVDDEVCENQCYSNNGMDYCIENADEEDFEVQRMLECDEMEIQNNNYRNWYYDEYGVKRALQFFVGPRCDSDGYSIYLDVFKDAGCTSPAESGTYEKYNYGQTLPYSSKSLVKKNCIGCKEVNDEDDDRQENEDEEVDLIELCENMYEEAGKCEKDTPAQYPRNDDCDYISDIVYQQEAVSKGETSGGGASTFFAWFFFLSTVSLAAVAYQLYVKAKRMGINLADMIMDNDTPSLEKPAKNNGVVA